MKHMEKKKYLEKHCRTHEDVRQHPSFMEAPGCSQAAGENSSSSEYFSCISSPVKLPHHDEDGIFNNQKDAPQLQSIMKAPGFSQAAAENSSSSDYFTCVSSPATLPHHNEDGFPQLQQNAPYLGELKVPLSRSARKRKSVHWNLPEECNIQQDTPQLESCGEVPGCSRAVGETASSSEYFTWHSSLSKLPSSKKDGIKERPVPDDLVQTETSSDYSDTSNSSHAASNEEPGLMKIYYMRVQMRKGVAVLCHTEEGWEPPSKRIKMEEMTYTKEVHKNVPHTHMYGKNLLNDPEPGVDSPAQEKREKVGCQAKPPTLVVYRRIPLWRPLDSGFRCLACCHVFSSLEVLRQHVEHGVEEGFSCHVFHRAMAYLKDKKLKRKNRKLIKAKLSCQEEKHFD